MAERKGMLPLKKYAEAELAKREKGSKSASVTGLVCPVIKEGGACFAGNLGPSCETCMKRYHEAKSEILMN